MDVDAAYTIRMRTPQELAQMQRCRDEGRCFRCLQQGHLSKQCPTKPKPVQANAASVAPTPQPRPSTTPATINTATVMAVLTQLTRKERQDVIAAFFMEQYLSSDDDNHAAHVNAVETYHPPTHDSTYRTTFLRPATSDNSMDDSDWHPRYHVASPRDPLRLAPPFTAGNARTLLAPWTELTMFPADDTPPTVVEDDNKPTRGVKTLPRPSVFTPTVQKHATSIPKPASRDTLTPPIKETANDFKNEAPPSVWATHVAGRSARMEKRKLTARGTARLRDTYPPRTVVADNNDTLNVPGFAPDDALTPYKFTLPTWDADDNWPLYIPRHPAPTSVMSVSPHTANNHTTARPLTPTPSACATPIPTLNSPTPCTIPPTPEPHNCAPDHPPDDQSNNTQPTVDNHTYDDDTDFKK
ncbi:hypothetical protein EDB83DRAFT_2531388 [Lactarius deliciosus]|nr:hypothetical protein EDB83DRAFT_2531388 [Lactarius deliciosus]